ncbi:MAG TPA: hypothetical protein VM187_05730, partial [Niastella sp.]|nr:hypothetical protein [Niastella sp.]
MATLFTHIKGLVGARGAFLLLRGNALKELPVIDDAFLIVEGEQIVAYGEMKKLTHKPQAFAFHIDATGKFVLPSWCDS